MDARRVPAGDGPLAADRVAARVDPFDAARQRLMDGKRRRRPRANGPKTIIPVVEPATSEDALSPDRLDAARASLRARIPPKPLGE